MASAREAAAVLERLPSLAAFGLPSPSAILLQNAAKAPAQHVSRPVSSTVFESASPPASSSSAFPQLRRGRPRLDRSTLRCAHCGSTESTQWRTSSLGPRTLCNACGLRAFRRRQRETKDTQSLDKKSKMEDLAMMAAENSPDSPNSPVSSPVPAPHSAKMSLSFLTS